MNDSKMQCREEPTLTHPRSSRRQQRQIVFSGALVAALGAAVETEEFRSKKKK
jgi:hypothetical protein